MAKINAPNGLFSGAIYFIRRFSQAAGLFEAKPIAPSQASCAGEDMRATYPLPGCDIGLQAAIAE